LYNRVIIFLHYNLETILNVTTTFAPRYNIQQIQIRRNYYMEGSDGADGSDGFGSDVVHACTIMVDNGFDIKRVQLFLCGS
jgi:hypothetical protein